MRGGDLGSLRRPRLFVGALSAATRVYDNDGRQTFMTPFHDGLVSVDVEKSTLSVPSIGPGYAPSIT